MLVNSFNLLHILSPPKDRFLSQYHIFFHIPICDSGDTDWYNIHNSCLWRPEEHLQYQTPHITLKFVNRSICALAISLQMSEEALSPCPQFSMLSSLYESLSNSFGPNRLGHLWLLFFFYIYPRPTIYPLSTPLPFTLSSVSSYYFVLLALKNVRTKLYPIIPVPLWY